MFSFPFGLGGVDIDNYLFSLTGLGSVDGGMVSIVATSRICREALR